MDNIARSVNLLYEKYPYPSLPIRNERDLVNKLHANVMSKILATAGLEPQSLCGKEMLDAGCGTGEKSCYFSYYGANVTALDPCSASLAKGQKLAEKFKLQVEFEQCDIAEFETEKRFDHVFCLGVLHHTSDPYGRFRVLTDICKPGGTVTVGLYNRYGRLAHRARRMWIRLNAGGDIERRMSFVERRVYGRKFKNTHEQAYAADKYVNPYESYHSVGEVLDWFNKNDITYIGSHPHTGQGKRQAFFSQLKWLLRRNGFFIISGRKN
ncbi:MAG: methyltransferase domain-containing protein [Candidatus Methanoperedens sp.]|nr:methyltransferase domain-containing protein [Candidatus Methanoperedens sp.]